jgi:ribonuclease HII
MSILVGIDEVGRGCWAGPMVVAAVILRQPLEGLRDSKLLSAKMREHLAERVHKCADTSLGWVSAMDIDTLGLTAATTLAMDLALAGLETDWDEIIIDGNYNYLPHESNVRVLPRADVTIPAVSAASIIAKVARDAYMKKAAASFPDYGFEMHVGYGTALHKLRLAALGPCSLHRMSYKPVKDSRS